MLYIQDAFLLSKKYRWSAIIYVILELYIYIYILFFIIKLIGLP